MSIISTPGFRRRLPASARASFPLSAAPANPCSARALAGTWDFPPICLRSPSTLGIGQSPFHPSQKPTLTPVFAMSPRQQVKTRPWCPAIGGKDHALAATVYAIKASSFRWTGCRQATWSAAEPWQQDRPTSTTSRPVSRRSPSMTHSQVLPHHRSPSRSRSQWPHLA
jgi:hypothetical protein